MNNNKKREVSEAAESNKISFYDLVSQAKSKRISSLEGYMDEYHVKNDEDFKKLSFIGFLEGYINELTTSSKKPLKQKKQNVSQNNDCDILINKIK